MIQQYEVFSAGRDRRVVVASRGARWFLLEGFNGTPFDNHVVVHGPFDDHGEAARRAVQAHDQAVERERRKLQVV